MQFIIHVNCVILNQDNKVLLVQEKKPVSYGKLNLPGGHLEIGEKVVAGVKREVKEEVNIEVQPKYLVGIYTGVGAHHFTNYIFYAEVLEQEAEPQHDEILDCKWMSMVEILNLDDEMLLNPLKLKSIIRRVKDKSFYPTDMIVELF